MDRYHGLVAARWPSLKWQN